MLLFHPGGIILNVYSAVNYAFDLGPIELVRDADQMPFWYDAEFARLRRNDTEFDFWHTSGAGKPPQWRLHGTLDDPLQAIDWTKEHQELVDYAGFTDRARFWLGKFYQISDMELMVISHTEITDQPYKPWLKCRFAESILYSADRGESWRFCGLAVKPNDDSHDHNIGGFPYIIVGEYFHVYFNEWHNGAALGCSVARAKVDDIVQAARNGTTTLWTKYRDGQWNEDGLTGLAFPLIPNSDTHHDAHYNRALGRYVMTNHRNDHILRLHTSEDGIDWDEGIVIVDYSDAELRPDLSWHMGFGGTDDCRELGKEFYIYWSKHTWKAYAPMYRRKMTITTAK